MHQNYIDILSINDLHGCFAGNGSKTLQISKIPGMVRLGYKVNEIYQENFKLTNSYETTLFVSGGDNFEGTGYSGLTRGQPLCDIFRSLNLKYSAVGNHDFDWGVQYLDPKLAKNNKTFASMGHFEFLSNNIVDRKTNKKVAWAKPYVIHKANGYEIAIIGVTSKATDEVTYKGIKIPNVINEEGIGDLFIFEDVVSSINDLALKIKKEHNPNAIIVLMHEGEGRGRNLVSQYVKELANVDAILTGHTHEIYAKKVLDKNNHPVSIIQSGSNSVALGKTRLVFDDQKKLIDVICENIMIDSHLDLEDLRQKPIYKSQELFEISDRWDQKLAPTLNKVIGEAKQSYIVDFSHGDFNTICSAGQCVCALLLEAVSHNFKHFHIPLNEKYQNNITCAIWNYGLVRSSLNQGTITYGDLYQMLPFDYGIGVIEITVKDLLKIFNDVYHQGHGYGYLQYAGIGLKTDYQTSKNAPFVAIYDLKTNQDYKEDDIISFVSNSGLISTGGLADHLNDPNVIRGVQLFLDVDSRDLICRQIELGYSSFNDPKPGILDFVPPKNAISETK